MADAVGALPATAVHDGNGHHVEAKVSGAALQLQADAAGQRATSSLLRTDNIDAVTTIPCRRSNVQDQHQQLQLQRQTTQPDAPTLATVIRQFEYLPLQKLKFLQAGTLSPLVGVVLKVCCVVLAA